MKQLERQREAATAAIEHLKRDLIFEPEEHRYFFKDREVFSATTILKPYFPFNQEDAIKAAQGGRNPLYVGKSRDEILAIWDENRDHGTRAHLVAENFINGEFFEIAGPKDLQAFKAVQQLQYVAAWTEVMVVAPEWGVAGQVDLLVMDHHGRFHILDFKTDKVIRYEGYKGEECPGLLAGFPACNYTKYRLQTSIYALVLEAVYGIPISTIKIIHLQEHTHKVIQLDPLYDYAAMLIQKEMGVTIQKDPERDRMVI